MKSILEECIKYDLLPSNKELFLLHTMKTDEITTILRYEKLKVDYVSEDRHNKRKEI